MKTRKFIDSVILHAKAGNGGNGCVSFRREKFVPRGGPDGGDGGHGGSIILKGNRDDNSLINIFFAPHQRAENAGHGKGKKLHGRNGETLIIKVPCGTEVWSVETGHLVGDIISHGEELLIARGGKGGLGNVHWKRSTHQAPRKHTDGELGEELDFRLELKLVADIGLVGFPNAGKSSLLTGISDAHPKIGAYPFTTLNPVIGTITFDDYTKISIADIPGLIKGAHSGVGLGYSFLRHIERSSFLVYVIDMAGVDARDPADDYFALKEELRLYKKELMDRPFLVIANKMDLQESKENFNKFITDTGITPISVSALMGNGLGHLSLKLHELVGK